MISDGQLLNYVNGAWKASRTDESLDVRNPATAETMVRVLPATWPACSPPVVRRHASSATSAERNRTYLRTIGL